MVQLKHMQDVNLHVQSQSSALGSPPTTRRRRNRCASFLPSMPLTVFLCCNRCCWMHLLAANVCRNELNVKVRNSILSVEHQEWRSHQVLVGVTREYNLYLYVTGVIICFTVSHVDSATTNRLRISRENQEEESGVSEWWRCAGVDALTSCHSSRGWNWLDLLFPASRQAECSTLNRAGDDVEILSAQTWNKRGKHIFNHSGNILILNGSREIYM